ncbi:MAG: hypothetical protein KME43_13345 [Myxacorys chilensis ATA2-1-KO14]|jgi:hypothetical protein|nr:hypothetical protein [Myxacorys chilensis ATA2-1-KO14]
MESLDFSSSVESDGLQFQGFVSQEVLQVSPALMFEPLQFQVGLRIKNNTSAPIRVNLFDTLNCTLVNADGSVTQNPPPYMRPLSPSERDFPTILSGETWLDAHRASLRLFVEGYELGWMTRWWRRFLKSVNPELAYSSVRWEIEHPLKLFIN